MRALSDPFEHFWGKVNKTDACWNWIGFALKTGYGRLYCGKERGHMMAHRVSWEIHNGAIGDGLCVCHTCDNPRCVRPDHLFVGTHQQNMQDRQDKGRSVRLIGERNGNAILTKDKVRAIRSEWPSKSQSELARIYGVHLSTIHLIVHGRKWKDIA